MRKFTFFKVALSSAILIFLFTLASFAQNCTLSVDFEDEAWAGTGYALRTVTDQWGDWEVAGVVTTTDQNDRHNSGVKSIRLRGNSGDNMHFQMNFDKSNGIGEISFYYASYSSHSGGIIVCYYSTDAGANWIEGGTVTAPAWSGEMIKAAFPVNIQGNVRIKVAREGSLASGTSVNVDDLCLTDFNPSGYVAAPTFNPPGGNHPAPVNVVISSATEGATIRYTIDGNDPTESSTQYSTPVSISEQTTLKAKAWKTGMQASPITTANYVFPTGITTLAALRALAPTYNGGTNTGTDAFTYTGRAVVTHIQTNNASKRTVKYIQDETAAIYIYDVGEIIQSDLEVGDLITDLSGTLTNYFGLIEFIPTSQCEIKDYGKQIETTVITASQLDYNHNNPIQAKVVTLKNVMYTQTGVFLGGKYYDLKENSVPYDSVVYTDNYGADYITPTQDPIPTIVVKIDGVCMFKGAQSITTRNRIIPLNKNNKVIKPDVGINDFNKSVITLSPNPANSFVKIITGSPMKLELYSLIGKLITTEYLYEGDNIISVSDYPAGLYLMKLTDKSTGETLVQKLILN